MALDFSNPRVALAFPDNAGWQGDVTVWGDSLIVQEGVNGGLEVADPDTATVTSFWGDYATRTTGVVDAAGNYYWWTFRAAPGYVITDPSWLDVEYLQQSGGPHGWGDTVTPYDVNLAPDGRIWAMSASRDFWVFEADGTIWRHFNTNATGGGDPRWPDAPLGTAFDPANPDHVYMLGDDGIFFADMADPAYIQDDWPTRAAEGYPDWPGEYTVLFDRLLAFETNWSTYPPAAGYDFLLDELSVYQGCIGFYDGRLYFLNTGSGAAPPYTVAVWSCALDGSDLTQEWSQSGSSEWLTSMDIGADGMYVYDSGNGQILHFPLVAALDVPTLALPDLTIPYRNIRRRGPR